MSKPSRLASVLSHADSITVGDGDLVGGDRRGDERIETEEQDNGSHRRQEGIRVRGPGPVF